MKEIPLTQGFVALVDDDDYEGLSKVKWTAYRSRHTVYAVRSKKCKLVYLHRHILQAGPGIQVGHVNGDGLNNTRSNLILTTVAGNAWGFQTPRKRKTSRFRGVSWNKRKKKWRAELRVDGKSFFLGLFEVEEDAARARDAASRKYYGDVACLNFP